MHHARMPTATLRFRLPEDEGEFRDAVEGSRAKSIVILLDDHLATEIKGGELGHDVEVAYQELREWLRSQCAEHGLDLL
jgi:hypothetical protein